MPSPQTKASFTGREHHSDRGMLSDIDLKILWVARTLFNIDKQFEPKFLQIAKSTLSKDRKKPVRDALVTRYHERCAPYMKLLAELRRQQQLLPASYVSEHPGKA